jgi:quinol monooxygenase YgiN
MHLAAASQRLHARPALTPRATRCVTQIAEWISQEALDAHNESVHFREYVPKMRRAADIVLRKLFVAYVPGRKHPLFSP